MRDNTELSLDCIESLLKTQQKLIKRTIDLQDEVTRLENKVKELENERYI